MIDAINQIQTLMDDNFTISYSMIGDYQDFIAKAYPAICIEAEALSAVLSNNLSYEEFDENDIVSVWYVEKAPQDRSKSDFITKVDSIVETFMNNPRMDNNYNMGIGINVEYANRSTEDNIEFIAKITIEGRNV